MAAFRVIKIDDTKYWNFPELVALVGKLYSVYVYDPEERTFCCEITPSRCLWYIGDTWDGSAAWNALSDEECEDYVDRVRDACVEQEGVAYMWCSRVDKLPFETIEANSIKDAVEYAQCNGFAF